MNIRKWIQDKGLFTSWLSEKKVNSNVVSMDSLYWQIQTMMDGS